jgi:hypothetical protein
MELSHRFGKGRQLARFGGAGYDDSSGARSPGTLAMNRFSRPRSIRLGLFAACIAGALIPPARSVAQVAAPRSAPHDGYWLCFDPFFDGDFRTAAKMFREAARMAS